MAPVQPTTLPKPASTSGAAISNFRLGENDLSDASDSDQSGHSERSLSPSGAKKSKAKKRKERKQVGALTDELGTLLGAAFQTPNADAVQPNASSATTEQATMEIDATSAEKKLPKRTRQNIAKMEKRKLAQQARHQLKNMSAPPAAAGPKGVPSNDQRPNQSKKGTAKLRRQRKEKSRAKNVAEGGDAMEIE